MNFKLSLTVLTKHQVEFVVVGGVAVVAHGSTLMTQDLDIVYRVEKQNILRLLDALTELEATALGDPRKLKFGFDHLNNHGHHLNETKAGRLDLLGSIGVDGKTRFEDLIDDAVTLDVFGLEVRCISLEQLIAVKKELDRPRDRAAVMELLAIKRLKGVE